MRPLPEEGRFKGNYRLIVWILLIGLTISILLFPVHLNFDSSPIQSIRIFANLPLFGALFTIWMGFYCYLLFSRKENDRTKSALACIFVAVFLGFWVVITPYAEGGDRLASLGYAKDIQDKGRLIHSYLGQYEFPGFPLVILFLSQVLGLSDFAVLRLVMEAMIIVLGIMLYILFANSLKSSYLSGLAVLLVVLGNMGLTFSIYHYSFLAFIFLLAFLLLLFNSGRLSFRTSQGKLIAVLLQAAVTVTHFVTSILFSFILTGVYLVRRLRSEKATVATLGFASLSLIIVLSWQIHWSTNIFEMLVEYIPLAKMALVGGETFTAPRLLWQANIGERVPFWAAFTRQFWLVLIYGFGTILWFKGLIRFRQLTSVEQNEIGGLLGVVLLTLFATFLSLTGIQFIRFVLYGSIFCAPLIVRFCLSLGKQWQQRSVIMLLAACLIFSFPTFLAYKGNISVQTLHPHDIKTGEFLQSVYGAGKGLHIYTNGIAGADINIYYLRGAMTTAPREFYLVGSIDTFWKEMAELIDTFQNSNNSIFIYLKRGVLEWMVTLGIDSTDPKWQEMKDKLSIGNKIFDNYFYLIYLTTNSLNSGIALNPLFTGVFVLIYLRSSFL